MEFHSQLRFFFFFLRYYLLLVYRKRNLYLYIIKFLIKYENHPNKINHMIWSKFNKRFYWRIN